MAVELNADLEKALNDAVPNTEREKFAFALDDDPSETTGDRSPEEMGEGLEGEHVIDENADEDEPKPVEGKTPADAEPEPKADLKAGDPAVPLSAERERRRTAEAERDASNARYAELRAEIDALKRGQSQPKQDQQADKPDLFADPDKYLAQREAALRSQFDQRFIAFSFGNAMEQHGDKFKQAMDAAVATGQAEARENNNVSPTVKRIWNADDPGRALMKWHGEQMLLREVGSDPAAYRERQRAELRQDPEFRKEVLADARAEASGAISGRPNTTTRMPKSLNGATGGGAREADPELYDASDGSAFRFATQG